MTSRSSRATAGLLEEPRGTAPEARRRPRVVFLIDSLDWGGAERLLLQYLPYLRSAGFDARVGVLGVRAGNPVAAEIRALGVPVDLVPVGRLLDVTAIPRLAAYLRRHRADLVHTQLEAADALGSVAAALLHIPCVATLHTMSTPAPGSRDYWRNRVTDRVMSVFADRIIAVSDSARAHYERHNGYPERKLVTLRNGIHLGAFRPDRDAGRTARRDLGIPDAVAVMMTVAVLRREKGVQYALEALPGILRGHPDARYVVVGDGDHRSQLEALARELGVAERVIFAGSRADVPRFLAAADVFLLPTLADALPTVLAEAMSTGVPLIASNVGGVPEMCIDERTGLLVEPGDTRALEAACLRLLDDPELRRRLGQGGREVARERFDVDRQAQRLADLYRRLMARR